MSGPGPERVVVIGAGLAGAAVAWGLARQGRQVVLVEQEPRPGVHASGRNAGLIRQVVEDPAVAALTRRGAALLADPPADLREVAPGPLVQRTGSILLAGAARAPQLRAAANDALAAGIEVRLTDPASLGEPLGVRPERDGVAVVTAGDGVADPHAVLSALLNAARRVGALVHLGRPARLLVSSGQVTGVELSAPGPAGPLRLEADLVVNAAGPWAAELVRAAGAFPLELVSYRRHLYYTGPLAQVEPSAPWVWDTERGFYVRPESSGLLLCACDQDARPPEDAQPDEAVRELLARKVARVAPGLGDHPVARHWAGLRTFAPDERFVIGWDPELAALFWATALGGHGLTSCCAVGLEAAAAILGEEAPLLAGLGPERFLEANAERSAL